MQGGILSMVDSSPWTPSGIVLIACGVGLRPPCPRIDEDQMVESQDKYDGTYPLPLLPRSPDTVPPDGCTAKSSDSHPPKLHPSVVVLPFIPSSE